MLSRIGLMFGGKAGGKAMGGLSKNLGLIGKVFKDLSQ